MPKFVVTNVSGFCFPLDMLRYDHCDPATSADASKVQQKRSTKGETVTLMTLYNRKATAERWLSFGWQVTEDGGK